MAEKGNSTGLLPANGHRIQGRSSEDFLDADEILGELNLKGNETLIDAGCGDGHVAIKALDLLPEGVAVLACPVGHGYGYAVALLKGEGQFALLLQKSVRCSFFLVSPLIIV